jgi:hypothetical protein
MRKIIRKPIKYKLCCESCGCEFSYEYEDIKFSPFAGSFVVECPNCKCNNDHDKKYSVYEEEN